MLRYSVSLVLLSIIQLASTSIIAQTTASTYRFTVSVDFRQAVPGECIPVTIRVQQSSALLLRLIWKSRINMHKLEADGQLSQINQIANQTPDWQWNIPEEGGQLSYCLDIDSQRNDRYDARLTSDWAWFRADDLFPPARATTKNSAHSDTRLNLQLPATWTAATPFERHSTRYYRYSINDSRRRFDRPTGWVLIGKLGIRRDHLANTAVTVAAPLNQGARRLDLMALLGFTLPTVRDWIPDFPERLLITLLSDQTWRGGLSGPSSLYLRADRSYISENSTSPLLHELIHVGLQRSAAEDWIDEGLAEYLGLVILYESGGITTERFEAAINWQLRWSERGNGRLRIDNSKGADTAKAVGIFAALHKEMGDDRFKQLIHSIADLEERLTLQYLTILATNIHSKPVNSLPN